jgi:alanine racemase
MIEPTAFIDLAALRHNFSRVKQCAPQSKVICMVKSNAYGHGLVQVAHTLKDADAFGVARLREALHLREAAVTQDIVLMPGFLTAEQLPIISVNNIQVVVHNTEQVAMLEQAQLSNSINIWVKVDTGMGRLGFTNDQLPAVLARLNNCACVDVIRFMTHFAVADDLEHPGNQMQIERLTQAQAITQGEWTAAKSAAVMAFEKTHAAWVRPGIMLYGTSPISGKTAAELDLRPVMTLKAPIISIKTLAKGEPVGYGSTFICPEDMPVGVVAIGYGDGYPRHAEQGTPVLVNNQLAPRIGRVCMDMFMVDLRGVENVALGDVVTLWGEGLSAEIIAKHAETIPYELFCSVTKRVKFEYLRG